MKKSILTVGLLSLVMILTSFTVSETNIVGGQATGGNMKLDIVGGQATGGNMKLDIVGGQATGGNMKLD